MKEARSEYQHASKGSRVSASFEVPRKKISDPEIQALRDLPSF